MKIASSDPIRDEPIGSEELARSAFPYVDHAIECFGIKRCMFESNFPMDWMTCSYGNWLNAFKRIVLSYSRAEKLDLLFNNANRIYRLGLVDARDA